MTLLYLSIPFMLLAIGIAIVPLVWAMRRDVESASADTLRPADVPATAAHHEALACAARRDVARTSSAVAA
jgi:hypothetical protein